MDRYLKEVIDLHVLIETLFARAEGTVAAMLERFHRDFKMVTPGGAQIGLAEVASLFAQRTGAQPGLSIELNGLETLAQWPESAVVRYCETHHLPGQQAKTRLSTAVFTVEGGRPLWRHLQETWAA
ncbi:nuclear transport factor 2 family protein [Pseudomonas sp. NPDC089408]|uniref:nuclear transport factor 2 family protein n=1 Tax=Pseudomonas sp. NPDC089408 TaxID=3364465 RepID=UPI0037FDFCCB